jgi:Tfp pilus assembly protein PilF
VRSRVIFVLAPILAALCAPAEVIHLKNGRTIWADHVRESGAHLEYDVGENSYAIPKFLVERVEAGGLPPAYATAGGESKPLPDLPAFTPNQTFAQDASLAANIVHDGHVDTDALKAVEDKADHGLSATANFIAGKHDFDHGDLAQARRYFEAALRFQPNNSTVLIYYSVLLVRTGNASHALSFAEQSTRTAPDSPDAWTVLGYAQFSANRTREAIQSWKKSLKLRPDPAVQTLLAKAEREATAEAAFSERESSHFVLRFEGNQSSESLRGAILATLETEYDDLVRELGISPRNTIPVVLYTDQAFFDVTHAPSWTGAVNDGKLRIPIHGLDSVTPELARILKHELAHSFIGQISGGRCPQWLNEGIAQLVEPKTLDANGYRLAQLFRDQQEIPFNGLETSFMRFSSAEAALAYDESLAAALYINDTYSMSDLQRILEKIGQGNSAESSLRSTIHSDYADLGTEVGKYLTDKYGR